jgi:carboxyl-terminal processing protease
LKRWAKFVGKGLFAALIFTTVPVAWPQNAPLSDDVTVQSLKFTQAYSAIQQDYMEAVDPERTILNGGVRGMLSALDPFSSFFDRDQFELLQQQTRGEALGFGSVLYVAPGKILVLETAPGSPSWRAGLGPGDEIVEINGTRINRIDFQSLVELLTRSRSHPVRLGVIHPGRFVSQDFELKPAEVAQPSVDKSFLLSPGVGYIHLTGFEQKTPKEVSEAVVQLAVRPLKGLVLDLRDNHGGVVDAAIGVASLFLKPGTLVMTMRGRSSPEKAYRTAPLAALGLPSTLLREAEQSRSVSSLQGRDAERSRSVGKAEGRDGEGSRTVAPSSRFDMPIIVLVNGDTASAAEVLAAALQEHDRAVIAGEPTYGKGVVQSVTPLSEGNGLALLTAQYFTPSGRSLQRPLPGTALAAPGQELDPNSNSHRFSTDDGRPLAAGGGITPDVEIPPRQLDPWLTFLNRTGAFTSFASDYLTLAGRANRSLEPDAAMLEDFKEFLSRGGIRTPQQYWDNDQDYLKLKVKVELVSLVSGLPSGEEVETKGDPQVQRAASLLPQIPKILKGTAK